MKRLLIDYGATRCRYIAETGTGENSGEFQSNGADLEAFIKAQADRYAPLDAVHIAYAGQVVDGTVRTAPNVKENHGSLKERLEKELGIPVKIENDLKCAALAEYHDADEPQSLFAAYIGTGFGGAFVEAGRLVRGHSNLAGEIGHIPFKKAPFLCGCGKDDCVEIYCSGRGLEQWVAHYGLECAPTLEAIEQCGCENSEVILQNFYLALSHTMATVVTLFNPSRLVLGGSVVMHNRNLEGYVRENVERYAFLPASKDAMIAISRLNNGCLEGTKWL